MHQILCVESMIPAIIPRVRGCGRFIGLLYDSTIENCYTTSNVSSNATDFVCEIGGLIGITGNSSAISNCIAFGNSVSAQYHNDNAIGSSTTDRVVGKMDATSAVANCYAKDTMTVKFEDVAVTLTKGAALKAGADISAMTDTTSAPLSSWEFGEDSNGDGMARPILYFDPYGDGTFEQLGPDDGMLS